MIIWYVFVYKILVLRNVKIVKRPVHSSVWCNFFVTRFSKKISWIFKELCLCWFSSKRKYRLISPLAIHIYFFFNNFVFACFAFLILLKNGQVFCIYHRYDMIGRRQEAVWPAQAALHQLYENQGQLDTANIKDLLKKNPDAPGSSWW